MKMIRRLSRGDHRISECALPSNETPKARPNTIFDISIPEVSAIVVKTHSWINSAAVENFSEWAFGQEISWTADQDRGKLDFLFGDGFRVTCDLSIIASEQLGDWTFLWADCNPSISKQVCLDISAARKLGLQLGIDAISKETPFPCKPPDARILAGIAAYLAGCRGLVAAVVGNRWIYLGLNAVQYWNAEGLEVSRNEFWYMDVVSRDQIVSAENLVKQYFSAFRGFPNSPGPGKLDQEYFAARKRLAGQFVRDADENSNPFGEIQGLDRPTFLKGFPARTGGTYVAYINESGFLRADLVREANGTLLIEPIYTNFGEISGVRGVD